MTMRSFNNREKMSKARSPAPELSMTMGTRGMPRRAVFMGALAAKRAHWRSIVTGDSRGSACLLEWLKGSRGAMKFVNGRGGLIGRFTDPAIYWNVPRAAARAQCVSTCARNPHMKTRPQSSRTFAQCARPGTLRHSSTCLATSQSVLNRRAEAAHQGTPRGSTPGGDHEEHSSTACCGSQGAPEVADRGVRQRRGVRFSLRLNGPPTFGPAGRHPLYPSLVTPSEMACYCVKRGVSVGRRSSLISGFGRKVQVIQNSSPSRSR